MALNSVVSIGPLPSMGWPRAFDDSPDQGLADGDGHDAARAADFVAFLVSAYSPS